MKALLKLRFSSLRHRDLSRFWRSYLCPLVYLLAKHFKLFGFPTFRFWAYM